MNLVALLQVQKMLNTQIQSNESLRIDTIVNYPKYKSVRCINVINHEW